MLISHIKPVSGRKWNSTSPYFMMAGGRRAFTECASTSSGWPKVFVSARRSAPSEIDPKRPQPRKSRRDTIGMSTERMFGAIEDNSYYYLLPKPRLGPVKNASRSSRNVAKSFDAARRDG